MNPHHRKGKHNDDSSASWDLFSSGSEEEGYTETRSASIHRDADVRETAQARLSRSADVPWCGVSIDKGPSVGTYMGRPLARQKRSPAGTWSQDEARTATITSSTTDHTSSTSDRITSVSPSNQRHTTGYSSASRLHSSGHYSERDVMPCANLKRSPATSTIPGVGTGAGASIKLNTLPMLSSPQKVSTGTTHSPPRPSHSVHFSKTGDNRKYKSKEIEMKIPSKAVIPTSTRSFIPRDQESLDESYSTNSSSSSEFKLKKTRTRAKGGSKGSSTPRSRAALPGSRGVHSINARKASSKPIPPKTVGRERRSTDTARYPSRKGSSDEASSSGGMFSTFSSTTSCTSTEESRDDGVVEAKEVTITPSPEKLQRTTAVQTEESSASRPVCVSRASQTDVQKPAKRAVSRTAPSKQTVSSRTPAKLSFVPSGKTTLEGAYKAPDICTRDGTSGKVPLPPSSAEATRRRQQQGTAPSSPTTPSIERVSSIEPSTSVAAGDVHSSTGLVDRPEDAGVVDSPEEVAALRCSSPVISRRPRFAKKGAHIEEGLLPPGRILVESPVANVPGGLKEDAAVSETPTPQSNSTAKTTGLYRSIEDVVGTSDEHRGHQSDVMPKVVIPPSMPTENSVKVHSLTQPTENEKGLTPGPNRHPAPEWSVVPEQRGEASMESPIPEVTRGRLWQPMILCSAAGAMILLPLAFVLIPLMGSVAGGAKRHGIPRSPQNGTDGKVGSVHQQEVYVEDADVPISCNGSGSVQLDNVSSVAVEGAYSAPYRGHPDPKPQFRPLLCVFEAEFFHPKRPYTAAHIPTAYCTAVVFYSVSLHRFGGAIDGGFRRPLDAELFENVSASRFDGTLRHRGRLIPLYVTFGGRRSDSADYVRMLRDSTWRKDIVEGIVNDTDSDRPVYDGVNLDWNHPGDECDVLKQPQLFHALVESLVENRVKVMVTVPPLPRYVALYELDPLLAVVDHVVLATHKLRPRRSSVHCSGARLYAAPAFRKIRDSFSAAHRRKFAYSVSVGGDTFVTKTVALGASAHAVPLPDSGLVLRPNKTSFESVCNVKPVFENPAEKECVVAIMQIEKSLDGGAVYYVAAYAGPKQLQERMHRSYEDDMGDAAVVVYDAFLDDFAGLCPGDSPRMSPQLASIAESTTRVLLQ